VPAAGDERKKPRGGGALGIFLEQHRWGTAGAGKATPYCEARLAGPDDGGGSV
jgi:hypothetical protein